MQVSGAEMLCLRAVAAGHSCRWLRSVGLGGRAGRGGAPLLTLAGYRDEGHVQFFASVPFGLLGTAGSVGLCGRHGGGCGCRGDDDDGCVDGGSG
jgi:hypothetical protein